MSLPVDVLITEHKLILRAVELIRMSADQIHTNKAVNPNFFRIQRSICFRPNADRFQHGKEELSFSSVAIKN